MKNETELKKWRGEIARRYEIIHLLKLKTIKMKTEYKTQIQPLSIVELAILREAMRFLVEEYEFYLRDYGQEIINIKHILNNPDYV